MLVAAIGHAIVQYSGESIDNVDADFVFPTFHPFLSNFLRLRPILSLLLIQLVYTLIALSLLVETIVRKMRSHLSMHPQAIPAARPNSRGRWVGNVQLHFIAACPSGK